MSMALKRQRNFSQTYATLSLAHDRPGVLELRTSYHAGLNDDLKRLFSYQDSRGGKDDQGYFRHISAQHEFFVLALCQHHLGITPDRSYQPGTAQKVEQRTVLLDYLGGTYLRENGCYTATGAANSEIDMEYTLGDGYKLPIWYKPKWSLIFPEKTLREYTGNWSGFQPDWSIGEHTNDGPEQVAVDYQMPPSPYATLGLKVPPMPDDATVKKSYRLMARQWHPDVCKEANAAEMFRKIGEAFNIVKTAEKRAEYAKIERILRDDAKRRERRPERIQRIPSRTRILFPNVTDGDKAAARERTYRTPLRNGVLVVSGYQVLHQNFYVTNIHDWQPIVDQNGAVLVSTMPSGSKSFSVLFQADIEG